MENTDKRKTLTKYYLSLLELKYNFCYGLWESTSSDWRVFKKPYVNLLKGFPLLTADHVFAFSHKPELVKGGGEVKILIVVDS